MPLYEFVCDCGSEEEKLLPMSESGSIQLCSECNQIIRRRYSPIYISIPLTGRDKVLGALNGEKGYKTPGEGKHDWRYGPALAKGLDHDGQVGQFRSGVAATSRTEKQGG